jgi:hypothetical protein
VQLDDPVLPNQDSVAAQRLRVATALRAIEYEVDKQEEADDE